eukprot:1414253-Karenia_brevis.AAC.1
MAPMPFSWQDFFQAQKLVEEFKAFRNNFPDTLSSESLLAIAPAASKFSLDCFELGSIVVPENRNFCHELCDAF